MKIRKFVLFIVVCALFLGGGVFSEDSAAMEDSQQNSTVETPVISFAEYTNTKTIRLYAQQEIENESQTGYKLFRSEDTNDYFVHIKTGTLANNFTFSGYLFQDSTVKPGHVYYYKLQYTKVDEDGKIISGDFSEEKRVVFTGKAPKIKKVKATKANCIQLDFDSCTGMSGYTVYVADLGETYKKKVYIEDGTISFDNFLRQMNGAKYKKYKEYQSTGARKMKYTKAKHGRNYCFIIRPYLLVSGTKYYGENVKIKNWINDYYYCFGAKDKKYRLTWTSSLKKAKKMMTTIKVKCWCYRNRAAHSGPKITRTQYIVVNKNYAKTIKKIYAEIYRDKSKPPIYEAGGFRWRKQDINRSLHTLGVAIDMNANENPYYTYNSKGKRVRTVGSFYRPKSNPYSIPRNGVIEKTFKKYGFWRLDYDLMHFQAG